MVSRSYNGGRSSGQLNFHQLYIFQTVASHLSFSRAAEAMEITQPAVSIQVQELEKFLGVTLFHRRSRGLRITEAGEAVLAYSLQIFALSSQLMETVHEMEDLQSGRLVLGASSTPGEYVLPMIVGRFRQIYPGIRVELAIGTPGPSSNGYWTGKWPWEWLATTWRNTPASWKLSISKTTRSFWWRRLAILQRARPGRALSR